jgi:hypothetical protein
VPAFLQASGPDMREEPAEQLYAIEVGRAGACTAHWPGGAGDRVVREADEAVVGDGHLADRRSEGRQGGVAVGVGLTVAMPGDGPDLRGDGLQQAGVVHLCLEKRPGNGGERFNRDEAVGSGGTPWCAVPGEATARDEGVDVRVGRERSTPGRQDTGKSREVGPDEALVFRQPFEGRGRRLQQGLVGEALVRADEGTSGCRDGEGAEAVWPRQRLIEVMCEPLLGCRLLTRRAMTMATGMVHAVLAPTRVALRETVAVVPALARWDGADALAVGEGQMGVALQVVWSKGGADLAESRHGRSFPSWGDVLSG